MPAPVTGVTLSPNQINEVYVAFAEAIHYEFNQVYNADTNWAKGFVTKVTTDQDTINLPFVESIARLNLGARGVATPLRNILGGNASIEVAKYEDGFEVSFHDIASDRLDLYVARAQDLATAAALLVRDLVSDALRLGDTAAYLMYDGQNYFANAHPKGGTTFDNLLAGALDSANYQATRTAMRRFPSDAGAADPLGMVPSHLVVPPDLEYTAMELMNNSFVPGGQGEAEQIIRGMSEVVVDVKLTDTNDWYVVKADGAVKPFVHVQKQGFAPFQVFRAGDDPEGDAHKREVLQIWGRTYETVYPTRPEFAIKVVN
jgi:phage major head subunit gpT-like protein